MEPEEIGSVSLKFCKMLVPVTGWSVGAAMAGFAHLLLCLVQVTQAGNSLWTTLVRGRLRPQKRRCCRRRPETNSCSFSEPLPLPPTFFSFKLDVFFSFWLPRRLVMAQSSPSLRFSLLIRNQYAVKRGVCHCSPYQSPSFSPCSSISQQRVSIPK